ncbi:hypothetical protein, partial [Streptomyces halstedii]|uniref:hypothetical protein n=1 Tax=Streptomyces halstedii TaxID=1944 RepID=UPI0033BE648B
FSSLAHLARTAERGKFDFFFLAGEGPRPREHPCLGGRTGRFRMPEASWGMPEARRGARPRSPRGCHR